ncbi:hypothetical protein STRIP9103_02335 [Streptomyces ipomoeae 91-03]|uniref:Uncharacterized protein n=1 Tax=Streptomyces ipomoeae 91-03 TaxID=698759 RepID=L1KMD7_9ACTN|nr:hypothetical protein STRIP9103_02335 [Streptomyces ipomoeae 91-03]
MPSATAAVPSASASSVTECSSARSPTPATPNRACAAPAPPTKEAAAFSSPPSSPRAGAADTASPERPSGPKNPSRHQTSSSRRWYLTASWTIPPAPTVPLEAARAGGLVGVDTNADRLAAWRLDAHGNPVGAPRRFGYDLTGNVAHRDAQIRHALIRLLLPHGPNATVWQSGSRTSTSPRRRPGRSTAAGSGSATLSPACP